MALIKNKLTCELLILFTKKSCTSSPSRIPSKKYFKLIPFASFIKSALFLKRYPVSGMVPCAMSTLTYEALHFVVEKRTTVVAQSFAIGSTLHKRNTADKKKVISLSQAQLHSLRLLITLLLGFSCTSGSKWSTWHFLESFHIAASILSKSPVTTVVHGKWNQSLCMLPFQKRSNRGRRSGFSRILRNAWLKYGRHDIFISRSLGHPFCSPPADAMKTKTCKSMAQDLSATARLLVYPTVFSTLMPRNTWWNHSIDKTVWRSSPSRCGVIKGSDVRALQPL